MSKTSGHERPENHAGVRGNPVGREMPRSDPPSGPIGQKRGRNHGNREPESHEREPHHEERRPHRRRQDDATERDGCCPKHKDRLPPDAINDERQSEQANELGQIRRREDDPERGEIWSTRWHLTDTHPDARDQAEAPPHENESSQAESRPLTR